MAYAKALTREYLEKLGVVDVFPLLHKCAINTPREGYRIKDCCFDGTYWQMQLYDPELRQSIPEEERDTSSGVVNISWHRLVYAFFVEPIKSGMVIDHINDDKLDNDPDNLQQLTPRQNLNKHRKPREIKCKLSRPLSYYELELKLAEEAYEEAKLNKDSVKAHRLRSLVAYRRGQIEYYKNHKKED